MNNLCLVQLTQLTQQRRKQQKKPQIQKKHFSKRVSYFPAKYTADIEKDYDYITGRVSKNSFGKSYSEACLLYTSPSPRDQA